MSRDELLDMLRVVVVAASDLDPAVSWLESLPEGELMVVRHARDGEVHATLFDPDVPEGFLDMRTVVKVRNPGDADA